DALQFEPIHRVLFHVDAQDFFAALREVYPDAHEGKGAGHVLECYDAAGTVFYTIPHPAAQLAVGTLQAFLDGYLADHPACSVDYIHGDDTARTLGRAAGNLAILLPPMGKEQLFKTVMADGVLPRKTFSMGHAQDKRYYLEARRIR
ncbi:MAG: DUF1015 family protein, partial [Oscillibacter sp.]|nr:DUF1015 family protein [Oscillibacter sp.]